MKSLTEKELLGINGGKLYPETREPDEYTCQKKGNRTYERCSVWHEEDYDLAKCYYSDIPCGSSPPIASAGGESAGGSAGGSCGLAIGGNFLPYEVV